MVDAVTPNDAANLGTGAIKWAVKKVVIYVKYVRKCKENVASLKKTMERLKDRRQTVQQKIEAAENNGERIRSEVLKWCEEVDQKIPEEEKTLNELETEAQLVTDNHQHEHHQAEGKCFSGCPPIRSRHKLSKKAEEVEKIFQKTVVETQEWLNEISYPVAPTSRIDLSAEDFEDFESRKQIVNDIMNALEDDTTSIIGVYGAGGVGKTTLVNEIARQVEAQSFLVVKLEFPQTPPDEIIQKIQDEVAEFLVGLTLNKVSTMLRARKLCDRLTKEGKKVFIIIDNIGKKLDLKEVGVPVGNKRCKVLLTATSKSFVSEEKPDEKTFFIDILEGEEPWNLFKRKLGPVNFDETQAELKSKAKEVVAKCGGFPASITALTKTLKGNETLPDWDNILNQMERPAPIGMLEKVYLPFKLSYSRLESEELKQTFLLCGLLVLCHNGSMEQLVRYSMGLGLYEGVSTVRQTRYIVKEMVSDLKASSLLNDNDYSNDQCISMHEPICKVALAIARDKHEFALRAEDVLNDRHGAIRGPNLMLLRMDEMDSSVELPPNFFQKLKSLKVLDFNKLQFSSLLPSSVDDFPKNLQILCLDHCISVEGISRVVVELCGLKILSLRNSDIERLPTEIGELTQLRLLDLSNCTKLKVIPAGVLQNLFQLEELYMGHSFTQWNEAGNGNQAGHNASLSELNALSGLTTLEVHILDHKFMPRDLSFKNLQRYKIFIGEAWDGFDKNEHSKTLKLRLHASIDCLIDGVKNLLKKSEAVYLEDLNDAKFVLKELGEDGKGFPDLKYLHIQNGLNVQHIFDDNGAADKIEFPQLRSLTLENLPELISLCPGSRGSATIPQNELPLFNERIVFPCLEDLLLISINVERIWHNQLSNTSVWTKQLKTLIIKDCRNFKRYLFSSSMARNLDNLQDLEISKCEGDLVEIVFIEETEEESQVLSLFPKLKNLKLEGLDDLNRFFSETGHRIELSSLSLLEIKNCPELRGFMYKSGVKKTQAGTYSKVLIDEKCDAQNLKGLTVEGCHNLRCLFSSSMVQSFRQLTVICISDCQKMKEVISMKGSVQEDAQSCQIFYMLDTLMLKDLPKLKRFCHGNASGNFEFPYLKTMELEKCPKFVTFISDSTMESQTQENNSGIIPLFIDKVAFPRLEQLRIGAMKNCTKIWQNQPIGDSFSKLNLLSVYESNKLSNIFTFSMKGKLQNLKQLFIKVCDSLQEIFESDQSTRGETTTGFEFPELKKLELNKLPKLKSFYSKKHTIEWKSLQTMWVHKCSKLEIFASESLSSEEPANQGTMFSVNSDVLQVNFPSLEEMFLRWDPTKKVVWHGSTLRPNFFCKLKHLRLVGFHDESVVPPHQFIQSLPKLERLVIRRSNFCQIFHPESPLANIPLKELVLLELPQLMFLWKKEYPLMAVLHRLTTLEVRSCDKLKILVPSSVCFENLTALHVSKCHGIVNLITCSTAHSLKQLRKMSIIECNRMKSIIESGCKEVKDCKVVFSHLNHLQLDGLQNLESFCFMNHSFEFPLLKTMDVRNCPKMKMFCQGKLSAPEPITMQLEEQGLSRGSLKLVIQKQCKEMVMIFGYYGKFHWRDILIVGLAILCIVLYKNMIINS